MNESISRAAGGQHGQEMLPNNLVSMIREMGRRPVRRNTLYEVVETFNEETPVSSFRHVAGGFA